MTPAAPIAPAPLSRILRRLAAPVLLGLILLTAGASAQESRTYGPPLDLTGYAQTFDEPFKTFDQAQSDDDHTHRWRTVFGYGGPDAPSNRFLSPNGEQQVYMDGRFRGLGINPFSLSPSGGLAIRADRTPQAARPKLWNQPYTSGLINTIFSFSQLYGYFEITAQIPHGRGFWPALWLLPTDGDWPPELDIMENLGHDTSTIYNTNHSKGVSYASHPVHASEDLSLAPHAYGALWTPTEVIWYLDRREVSREPTPHDMHRPMYILINLVVGGVWSGAPDASTPFPAELRVTHVGVWKPKTPFPTGAGKPGG